MFGEILMPCIRKKKKKKFFFANGIITSILWHSSSCRISKHFANSHISCWNCWVQWCKAAAPWVKSGVSVALKRHFVFRCSSEGLCYGDVLRLFNLEVRLDYVSIVVSVTGCTLISVLYPQESPGWHRLKKC